MVGTSYSLHGGLASMTQDGGECIRAPGTKTEKPESPVQGVSLLQPGLASRCFQNRSPPVPPAWEDISRSTRLQLSLSSASPSPTCISLVGACQPFPPCLPTTIARKQKSDCSDGAVLSTTVRRPWSSSPETSKVTRQRLSAPVVQAVSGFCM